jgi:magnesium transporter
MINLFTLQNGRLVQEQVEDLNELLEQHAPIWIDAIEPDDDGVRLD